MKYLERFARTRLLGTQGQLSPPYIYDRKRGQLLPHRCEEWWRSPEGLWIPAVRGGAFSSTTQHPTLHVGFYGTATGTQTTQALNTTYLYDTTGAVIGGKYRLPVAKTVNNIYFFITAYTGTAANVDSLLVEIRNDSGGTKPGSTVHATQTKNPASATGWINCSGLSYAGAANTPFWVSVAEDLWNATDSATVLARFVGSVLESNDVLGFANRGSADSTNGWSTTSLRAGLMSTCVTFSDGTTLGNPLTVGAATTNNTERRGLRLDGFTESIKLYGMLNNSGADQISGVELYDAGGTTPGSGQVATGTVPLVGSGNTDVGMAFETSPTLAKAAEYRVVFTYSASATIPRKLSIGTGADANLRAARMGGGGWYWAQANGTTNWANDDSNGVPQVALIIEDQVAVAGGGGGMRLAGHGGLAA